MKQLLRLAEPTANTAVGTDVNAHRFSRDFLQNHKSNLWIEFGGLAGAVAYLHDECNIVHSDIKPSNILLYETTEYPYVVSKLTDFGLAVDLRTKLMWQLGSSEARSAWQYDSPEIRKKIREQQSAQETNLLLRLYLPSAEELKSGDVWKLGSVFTELLTFLVMGFRGVPRFREFITTTTKELTSDDLCDARFDDGVVVKEEVLQWLSKLERLDCRASELTPLLRQMLDKGPSRPSAAGIASYIQNVRLRDS